MIPKPATSPVAAGASGQEGGYRLEGVSFAVAGRQLLAPLTLDLPGRGVVGLVGHNGSGKSTLIKLLGRQHFPSAGRITFQGRALDLWSDRAFARAVAYLPQATPQAPGLLARELVAMGRYPWHGALGRVGAADRRIVAEAMALTDTAAFADRLVDSLSGGERQRVWLAMLVAQDAGCLLLDEPISALDVAHQLEVLALVRRLADERGASVVVVLHDINLAARFCDQILALHGGRLIRRGTPDDLVTAETLEAIYGIRMGIFRHPDTDAPVSFAR
ncbi:MAG: ATP-binding cassette domain-containing protein [Methylobacterium sp.]|uniref:ATP-binding cassette domain-containing protein n=1 Tax=Methylobacterium sp. TaxID=409 RepID=UPI0025D235B4|nr:ATP-binding cassette domain-containing protein [Methylobacterium sp.]MBX9931608.1 ATP-binding cassette domain-containing protein [Methylobacterium sp.]